MSGFGAPGGRAVSYKPTPPEKGSFPLDHDAECKHLISNYLRCLKQQSPPGRNTEECRLLAKNYLECRMTKGLMARDDWSNLGFEEKNADGAGVGAGGGNGADGSMDHDGRHGDISEQHIR